jgi:hypothetical protein
VRKRTKTRLRKLIKSVMTMHGNIKKMRGRVDKGEG